jgi:hypothetical protein
MIYLILVVGTIVLWEWDMKERLKLSLKCSIVYLAPLKAKLKEAKQDLRKWLNDLLK